MHHRSTLVFAFILVLLLAAASPGHAQVTTGNLAGTVTTQGDGSALPGVTVEAVHTPTGTRYSAVSGANGRYRIPNVRVGGPYQLSANLEGFRSANVTGIQVGLGTTAEVPIAMQLAAVTEAITVTATVDEIINPNRTGSTSAISAEQIESLPTINRTFQDFARTNPYFNVDGDDPNGTRLSVAGRSERYNNIQIDGAVNNDLFGLSDSTGAPGGRVDALPISLEAIQQIQLVVSPYDVRQGGFTGGGVNAVSRSGTNDFRGSVFYSKRDPQFVGDGPFDNPISKFDQKQYGGRVGGRIMRDRLFFFVSGESNRREEPTGTSADGSTGIVYRNPANAARLRDFLISRYQYDPGSLGDISGKTEGDTFFGRLDWNVNNNNQLTLRHNYVDALKDQISNRTSTTVFRFPTATYFELNKTNSTVAQLNSVFGANAFNEGRVGYQTIRDRRQPPVRFPTVEIGGTGERRGELYVGTEQFSGANRLNQDIFELTDDFTWIRGNHTLVAGTHNEFFDFFNLFISERFGFYYFPTLADFEAGKASVYRISFGTGDNPDRPAEFGVRQYGLYVNDQWRVIPSLTLSFGLRGDKPSYQDTPSANPLVVSALGLRTDVTASESVVWSPRFGFNWSPAGGKQQVRGGIGVFAGRTPYVWVSNIFANTGVEQVSLGCVAPSCTPPPFNPDPDAQPRTVGAGGAVTVNLLDPDFTFPRVLRATLGYDRDLIWGVKGTVEGIWSKVQKDIFYINPNRVQNGTSPLDGRPKYARVSTQLAEAPMLTNTEKGEERTYSIQFNRPFTSGLTLSASYANQDTESAFDTTSSRAISSFQFNPIPGDIFKEHMARSFYETEHRFNVNATYAFSTGPFAHTLGLYYNAQTARPYSLLMSGDPNTDGFTSNDLLYVPASETEIILQNAARQVIPYATFADFLRSVGINPTSGRILDRNELTEPWSRELDLHYELGLPTVRSLRSQITFDVLNLLNMFNKEYGNVRFVSFQTYTPITYAGQDSATGKPIYREAFNGALNPGRQFSTANLRSRWQARLGLRLSF